MGLMDDLKDKAQDVMNDSDKREQIQKYAEDHNISFEAAKEKFTKKNEE